MSNLLIPYRGVIEIAGEHDAGKTLAALQTVYPYTKTVFVDNDEKGSGTVRQLADQNIGFGKYIDVAELRLKMNSSTLTPDDVLQNIVFPLVEEISKEKHEVIIIDTWNFIYQAARGHVEAHQSEYTKVVGNWHGNSPIVQGKISKVARMIEQTQLEKLKNVCDLLIVTSHLKDKYENNVPVYQVPESSKTFDQVCNLRVWLRRNPNSDVPIMLFLKRPNLPKVVNGKLEFVNIVPMKVIPNKTDKTIWGAMERYEKNPIGSRQPTEEETPTADEFAMLSGTLTPDQKSYVLEVLKYQKEEAEEVQEIVATVSGDWQSLPEKEIAKEIDNTFSETPKTGAEFLAKAMSEFGMNAEAIKDKIGVGLDKILKSSQEELREYWKGLQK